MRRGTRQTAAERKSDEEFDVQKVSPELKNSLLFSSKRGRPPQRKSVEEFDQHYKRHKTQKRRGIRRAKTEPKNTKKQAQTERESDEELDVPNQSTCHPLHVGFKAVSWQPRPVVGRCQSSLSGDHKPRCSASCSCRPAHRQCKARAAELCGNACAAPHCSCIAPRSPGRSPSVRPCRNGPARPRRWMLTAGAASRSGPPQLLSVSRSSAFCLRES